METVTHINTIYNTYQQNNQREGIIMAQYINIQLSAVQSPEAKEERMRKVYGDNTLVWFTRGWTHACYGHTAEVMEHLCGIMPEFDPSTGRVVYYWNYNNDVIFQARLVKAGYKIIYLQDTLKATL